MKCILLSRISTAQQSIDSQTNDLIKEAKREIILKYVDKVIINRDEVETHIDIEYKPFLIIPDKGSYYTYTQKGGYIKTYRHNTDGTVDKI